MADQPAFHFDDTPSGHDASKRLEGPIHAEKDMRIVIIGAGASGLLLAYKLQKDFQNISFTVYEKNPAVAGTWYENRYPGCACDVPAHNYTWSFEPKSDWSSVYPPAEEAYGYFEGFAQKYNLQRYVRLQHQVIGAYWKSDTAGYEIRVKDTANDALITDHCNILINAGGILNHWRWPDITGLDNYKGIRLHTAHWDQSVELEGKHVGLIGNGSSGIQVLPAIRDKCSKVTTFIRNPAWVSPTAGLEQRAFSEEERSTFENKPGALLEYRKTIENGLNGSFGLFLKNHKIQQDTQTYVNGQMVEKIRDENLISKLTPKFSLGCRRLTPGVNYLESLTMPNVEVVCGEIKEITERGCLCDDGKEYAVDILICATGFDTSFRPRFPIVSHTGENLQDKWATDPQSYLGVAVAGFPNYMTVLGPNSPVGNGPVLYGVEAQADWICRFVDQYQTTNMKMFMPKEEAVQDFVQYKNHFMKQTVWVDDCHSWYKNRGNGQVTALWPGSTLHYVEACKNLRLDDFDISYSGNRFAWLGNGYSQTELDETADWAYYIREHDDSPPLSTAGQRKLLTESGTVKERTLVKYS
ncbi:hypothetical protein F5B22DRAFT_280782 [Xylaria bambusicola]|uniref:uncharacterized protein n=1 Tax=Xylaria bambusicola TaxID=326684 RepID=UPI0020083546|nr:uncharacterized protein F5B22DRAFT_280782 [Xylaria bambusicola]KAI0512941.1 hypothetical protein F5B22DRAFT_280782 [Xylaria bambusicola]